VRLLLRAILKNILEKKKSAKIQHYDPVMSVAFSERNSEEILRLINEEKDLAAIPSAFWLLVSDDQNLKLRTAQSLHKIINSLEVSNLTKVDKLFRERTSYDWTYDWHNENPNNLVLPIMSVEERTTIFGLCSFHPNGYFREKAIKELSIISTGQELPYLFIRLNDWVQVVSSLAKSALLQKIRRENFRYIIDNLPLIYKLKDCERNTHSAVIGKVFEILSEKLNIMEFHYGLESKDSKVRLHCYDIAAEAKLFDNIQILNYIIKEKVPYIRMRILNKILKTITKEEFTAFAPQLLKDNYAPIRFAALDMLYKYHHENCIEELKKALTDRSTSIRERARYLLRKNGYSDFSSFYIESIQNQQNVIGAICGLGEIRGKDETKYLTHFLQSDKVNIVKATIKSLSKLDFSNFKELIITFVADPRIGVSRDARRILNKQITTNDGEKIYEIYKNSELEHVKINAAYLLCSLNKWNSINYIIEICGHTNQNLSRFGKQELDRWIFNFNRSYLHPSKEQLTLLKNNLNEYELFINEEAKEFIEFSIKDF
jgi:HEAT repeat protein